MMQVGFGWEIRHISGKENDVGVLCLFKKLTEALYGGILSVHCIHSASVCGVVTAVSVFTTIT
jgi:hypothetical protein